MVKSPRQFWLLVISVLSLAASSAFAEKKYGPGVTDTEIKIGQTYPYSGQLSAYSTMARTEAAVFAKQNAEGGINGRKIVFISLDDSYSPPKTVEQVQLQRFDDKEWVRFGDVLSGN